LFNSRLEEHQYKAARFRAALYFMWIAKQQGIIFSGNAVYHAVTITFTTKPKE